MAFFYYSIYSRSFLIQDWIYLYYFSNVFSNSWNFYNIFFYSRASSSLKHLYFYTASSFNLLMFIALFWNIYFLSSEALTNPYIEQFKLKTFEDNSEWIFEIIFLIVWTSWPLCTPWIIHSGQMKQFLHEIQQ